MNLKKNIESIPGGISEKFVVIADDFTGANDTGVQFCKRNLKSLVITNPDKISKSLNYCDVLIVDTESRFDDRQKAYNKAFETGEILKKENIKYIYKKLDSTFRGNIGAEISGLMDSLEIRYTVLVPAFPSNQRITEDGMVYVKGELLAQTEISNDPRTPVRESFIPKIVSLQTDKRIELININEVQAGKQNLIQKVQQLMKNGIQIIVIDALNDRDLDLIASVTAFIEEQVLFAGSAGFAEFLPKYLYPGKEKGINVVIAGSVSEVTRNQINYAKERLAIRLIDVETEQLIKGAQHQEKRRIMEIVRAASRNGEDIIVRSAPSATSVSISIEQGQIYGLKGAEVSEIIAIFLGEIARDIIHEINIDGIFLTGGDTAIKIAQYLNISGTIIQDEILPGIPYGHFIEEQYKNITIITKAGGFGNEDAIFQSLTFLRQGIKK